MSKSEKIVRRSGNLGSNRTCFLVSNPVKKGAMTIGYVWEEIYTKHSMGEFHPESPARLFAVKEVLDDVKVATHLIHLKPRPATKEEIAWVHDPGYIDIIEKTAGKSVYLDPDTSTSPATWEAACLAAGGVIACVDYSLGVEAHWSAPSFAFVRPPGHHAERARAMGFCIFNNIAIAAEYALRKHNLDRLAILDFDVHHGNGTQQHFYKTSDVFFASTHRMPFYPGTGGVSEFGDGEGLGFTINVPLRYGDGDDEFKEAWGKRIIPCMEVYAPELILVSAGFDAHRDDPLGGLQVTTDCYRWLAARLVSLAHKCYARLVFVLEGGYSLSAIKSCVRAILEEMF